MVNPKQLRLGNYIQDRGGKVLRIDFMEHVQEGYDTKVGQLMHLEGQEVHPMTEYTDYANPIPIIEEWLRKFSFVLEDVGTNPTEPELRYRNAYKGSFGIEFDTQKGTFTLHNVVGELVEYQYVHHLQNVYYWNTMKELEIKDIDPQNVHKIS